MKSFLYCIGNCPICHEYGELVVEYNLSSHKCCIICNECLAEWKNPIDAMNNVNGYRKKGEKRELRAATMDEIYNVQWESYIVGSIAEN